MSVYLALYMSLFLAAGLLEAVPNPALFLYQLINFPKHQVNHQLPLNTVTAAGALMI